MIVVSVVVHCCGGDDDDEESSCQSWITWLYIYHLLKRFYVNVSIGNTEGGSFRWQKSLRRNAYWCVQNGESFVVFRVQVHGEGQCEILLGKE